MRVSRARRHIAVAVTGVLAALACGCDEPAVDAPAAPAETSRSTPVDTTKPGEIAEGKEQAFGLVLPRDMRITTRIGDTVMTVGRLPFEHVANYVRERVDALQVNIGPSRTQFKNAVVRADNSKVVEVEVVVVRDGVQIVVQNLTREPAEPGLSDEERWRRAGLGPNGKVTKSQSE
jgi:hypothetical protein